MSTFITARELATTIADGRSPHLLDVRWSLATPHGRPDYIQAHIPGAVYVDLESDLSSHGAPTDGRHPLPSREAFERSARSWGLNDGDSVVVYDGISGLAAARAWWLLRHSGVRDVRILDGGLDAWRSERLPLQEGTVVPLVGSVSLGWGQLRTIDIDEAAAFPEHGLLLDARAEERYRGVVEPIDPVAGHIPGAVNAPTADSIGADGRLLDLEELRARFDALGADGERDIAVYCGSGVTAAHEIAVLAAIGRDAALYPGSWSQWSQHSDRPVAAAEAAAAL